MPHLDSDAWFPRDAVNRLERLGELEERALAVKKLDLETVRNLVLEFGRFLGPDPAADETQASGPASEVYEENDCVRNRRTIIRNCQDLIEKAEREHDPDHLLDEIMSQLDQEIGREKAQLKQAKLISDLVLDWSAKGDVPPVEGLPSENKQHLSAWISTVTAPATVNTSAIKCYLEKLFTATPVTENGLEQFRAGMKAFSKSFRSDFAVDIKAVTYSIRHILAEHLAEPEQQEFLRELRQDEARLQELVHELNNRAENLDKWEFNPPYGSLNASQHRKLTGEYRVYVHYDVVDLILWYIIGASWGSQLRELAQGFISGSWFRCNGHISAEESYRRFWFLGEEIPVNEPQGLDPPSDKWPYNSTINSTFNRWYLKQMFMALFPDCSFTDISRYGEVFIDEDEEDDEVGRANIHNATHLKEELLGRIAGEAQIAKHSGADYAVLCSGFELFEPSTPHQVILEVLSFFGVDEFWIDLFKKFLSAPFKFKGGQILKPERGVPISHPISGFFTEAVLFVMDFAVNFATHENVFRYRDDLWLRGTSEDVETAWGEIKEFATVFGFKLSRGKTGCVSTVPRPDLPAGNVRKGFLVMNDELLFDVDCALIEKHAVEMRRQLDASPSLLSFAKIFKSYGKFVLRNLDQSAYARKALGLRHAENSIAAMKSFMHKAFGENLLNYIKTKYNVGCSDNSMAVWYWPMRYEGVALWDPLALLYSLKEWGFTENENLFEQTDLEMLETFEGKRAEFEKNGCTKNIDWIPKSVQDKLNKEQFISKESYLKTRFYVSPEYGELWSRLHGWVDVFEPGEIWDLPIPERDAFNDMQWVFNNSSSYWKYILSLYGKELVEKFGGLQLTNKAVVPLTLADLEQSNKQQWTP